MRKKNVFLITELPFIYQSLRPLCKAVTCFSRHSCLRSLYQKGADLSHSQCNLDINLDFIDSWSDEGHVNERNQIIQWLVDELVKPKGKKVILLGGDVHSAGAGEVVEQSTGESVLWQLTSSAVTTEPVPHFAVMTKKILSYFQSQEKYGFGLVAKITDYSRFIDGQKSCEIALNNWLELEVIKQEIYPSLWALPSDASGLEKWLPQGWPRLESPQHLSLPSSCGRNAVLAASIVSIPLMVMYAMPYFYGYLEGGAF